MRICAYKHKGEGMEKSLKLFKALSGETRLRIVRLLQDRENLCVCEIMQALDISQTRASRNLGILKEAGLVSSRRAGLWVEYYLDRKGMGASAKGLLKVLSGWADRSGVLRKDRKRLATSCRVGPRAVRRCR